MSDVVELALPCQVVALTMRLGQRGQLTTLEDLIARTWLTDRITVRDMANFLELPMAIVKDVAIDMWQKGFMTFDLDTGVVELTDTTREILSKDGTLAESGGDVVTREFLFEPITGRVLPREWKTANERALRLPMKGDVTASDVDQGELVRAVQNALHGDERRGVKPMVLEVSFGNPLLRASTATRWVQMRVFVERYPNSNQVTITPTDSTWRTQDSRRLNAYLSRLTDEEPNHRFLQSLRGRAESVLRPPERIEDLVRKLGERVAELASTPPEQVVKRNGDLRQLAVQVRERLGLDQTAHAAVTVVRRAEGHAWALDDLIASARTQLVISSPDVAYQHVQELLPALSDAADRGVQIVIIWGRALEDDLPPRIGTAFATLRDRNPERVLVARRSARTEACVVVQDDIRALVGSYGPLSGGVLGRSATSILVEPADNGALEAVGDLLLWARQQFPHWQEGQRIKLHPKQFGRQPDVIRAPAAQDVPLPEIRPESVDESAVRLWAQSWAEHHAALLDVRAQADARGPIVNVIADGEHRTLLGHCVRGARRRLVITDDRIDPAVTDAAFAQVIRERHDAGATVLLVHPQLAQNGHVAEKFTALASGPDGVTVRREVGGARLMLSDDQLVVGSFSPLAGGHGRNDRGARMRSHVGLHIRSEVVAAELADALRAGPVAPPSEPSADQPVYTPDERLSSAVPAALPLLFAARAAGPGRPFANQVVDGLRDVSDPWTVIDVWHQNNVSTTELRTAAAALLRFGRQTNSGSGLKWTRWLVDEAWKRRAFVQAAVLGSLLTDEAADLRTTTLLTASIEFGPVDVTADAALMLADSTDGAAMAAGAVGALAGMLLWADGDGRQAVDLLGDSLPASWQELARHAVEFAATGVALPLESLSGEQRQTSDRLAVRARKAQLRNDIDKLRQLRGRFDFETGMALYNSLFAANGLLTTIDRACNDASEPDFELRDHLPADVQSELNRLIAAAGAPPMQWYRQGRYLRSIEDIVRSARIMVTTRAKAGPLLVDHRMNAACVALGRHLAAEWDRLFVDAKSVDEPYDQPFLAMLERLNPLLVWSRERL